LIFALDATASRSRTWARACELQAETFNATAGLGGLLGQLVFYRGAECKTSAWIDNADALHALMRSVHCVTGGRQIARILRHAITETQSERVGAVIFVGDCMEENADELCRLAAELGRLETPVFVFQEGNSAPVARAFAAIAAASGGAHLQFDLASIERLRELLGAVASYAVGGHEALVAYGANNPEARLLLSHLSKA
jgi:hypothetical protein